MIESEKEILNNNIERFKYAQSNTYEQALKEIKNGHKETHWIWWILPQMRGLGYSGRSEYYGIQNREEAKEYINDELLRNRLIEVCEAIYNNKNTVYEIFGNDSIKVCSCIKLFASVSDIPIFKKLISKYNWH